MHDRVPSAATGTGARLFLDSTSPAVLLAATPGYQAVYAANNQWADVSMNYMHDCALTLTTARSKARPARRWREVYVATGMQVQGASRG